MRRVLSTELPSYVGETVTLAGWLHRRRLLKAVAFAIVRDRGGLAQAVIHEPVARAALEAVGEETIVTLTGEVVANPVAPGGVELVDPVLAAPDGPAQPPPFELWRPELTATLPTILDSAAVARRHPRQRAALRVGAAAVAGFRAALDALDFVEIFTPKLVASATEGGANVFAVDYFGRPAYLAQSPQFYKQMMVGVFERVYEVGPVFRAEPHDTGRHLAQYTSLDAELGFIDDHRDVMAVLRTVIAGMVAAATPFLDVPPPEVPAQIPAVDFAEALAMMPGRAAAADEAGSAAADETGRVGAADELDLAPAHERWLGEWARREHGSDFLFVTGYPLAKRPFYTHPQPGRPGYTNGFDLLFRGVELVTGGQRLHRYADYVAALADRGLPLEPVKSYVDTFRHGMPPHGGFAIGLERFVSRLIGVGNVREVTAFPRDLHRLTP